jgi:hypothetical protein
VVGSPRFHCLPGCVVTLIVIWDRWRPVARLIQALCVAPAEILAAGVKGPATPGHAGSKGGHALVVESWHKWTHCRPSAVRTTGTLGIGTAFVQPNAATASSRRSSACRRLADAR